MTVCCLNICTQIIYDNYLMECYNIIFWINVSRNLIPLISVLTVEKCKFLARYLTIRVAQTFQSPTRPCITPDIAWSLIIHTYSHQCCYLFESVASRSSDVEKLITVITLNWIWSEWNFLESTNKTLITIRCENVKRLIHFDLECMIFSYNNIQVKYNTLFEYSFKLGDAD